MKTAKRLLLIALLSLNYIILQAQEKYSLVKVYVPDDRSIFEKVQAALELDHYNYAADGAWLVEVEAARLPKLKNLNIRYEVVTDDVAKAFEEQSKLFFKKAAAEGVEAAMEAAHLNTMDVSCNPVSNLIPTPTRFSTNNLPPGAMGGFYTYDEMSTKMTQLAAAFPTLVQKFSLGTTGQGRDMWAVKISDNVSVDENEPEVLYLGLQHAREAIGGTSLIFFMQYLAENYATNQQVRNLVNNREIFIVPCANPDGYVYNQTTNPSGGGMWRKNRRSNAGGTIGVDINRNYGVDWADCAGASSSCGSSNGSSDTYYGTSAFSEKETQNIRNFVITHHLSAAFDQHCSGPYYSLPFGRRSYHTMSALDKKFYAYIPALMGKYNGHRAGDSYATVAYEVAGGAKDWFLLGEIGTGTKGKIYGMTGEAGGGGFWAPSGKIIGLCKNLCFQDIQLALAAGSMVDLQDMSDIAVPLGSTGNFNFQLRRVGLANEPVTVTLIPLENIRFTGAPVTVNSLPNYYDTYNGNISYTLWPGLTSGQRIRYVWRVVTGGITTYDTVSKIYNPVTMFTDNMDAGTVGSKWTVSGGWGYATASFLSGTRSLAESPTGNYTTNSIRIAQITQTFNLTDASDAYLTFWVRHKAENFRDKMRIQASTNGSTWTSLCGKYTVQENNDDGSTLGNQPALTGIREEWTRELISLNAFNTAPNLRIRFEFTSDDDVSNFENERDDGFFIDDIKIVKTTNNLINLPVSFIAVNGKLINGPAIEVSWEAITDNQHDYFEIEKSADGSSFVPIGKETGTGPYRFIDRAPLMGNNFYRIKQYDKGGNFSYSKVINVVNGRNTRLTIYPNPVSDLLTIQLDDLMQESLQVQVTNMQGREVYNKLIKELPVAGEIKINSASWLPQVYVLKISNSRGEFITIQKFVKQ